MSNSPTDSAQAQQHFRWVRDWVVILPWIMLLALAQGAVIASIWALFPARGCS